MSKELLGESVGADKKATIISESEELELWEKRIIQWFISECRKCYFP